MTRSFGLLLSSAIIAVAMLPVAAKWQTADISALKLDLVPVELERTDRKLIQIGRYEVNFGQWQLCHADGGCRYNPKMRSHETELHPVHGVNWFDVQEFISWISNRTGKAYRLPTSAEWKTVAGGNADKAIKKLFTDPRLAWAADYASYSKRPPKRTRVAGAFGKNRRGIHDLKGNVWEWTTTCWRAGANGQSEESDTECGGVRILQGLHPSAQSELIREAQPGGCSTGYAPSNIGFRLVLDKAGGRKRSPGGVVSSLLRAFKSSAG